jgi:hypothetical protein
MFLLFGLLLIYTAIQLFRHRDEDPDVEDNVVVKTARRLLPVTEEYDGGKIFTRVDGRRMVHPAAGRAGRDRRGSTAVRARLDPRRSSGVTEEPFIVFTATPSRCSACGRCTSWSRACSTGWSTCRPGCRSSSPSSASSSSCTGCTSTSARPSPRSPPWSASASSSSSSR